MTKLEDLIVMIMFCFGVVLFLSLIILTLLGDTETFQAIDERIAERIKSNADQRIQDVESVGSVDRKTENSSEIPNNYEPQICDTCRYYNSNIPCGSTPSACKEADKFAEEFVEELKKLKPQTEREGE